MGQARVTIHLIFSRARVEILKKLTKRGPCHVRSRLMQLSYHYQVVKEQMQTRQLDAATSQRIRCLSGSARITGLDRPVIRRPEPLAQWWTVCYSWRRNDDKRNATIFCEGSVTARALWGFSLQTPMNRTRHDVC
jgi:hypothetical protein